jgi:hypothetical protein
MDTKTAVGSNLPPLAQHTNPERTSATTKDDNTAVATAFLAMIAVIAISILGINGTIPDATIMGSLNISLSGIAVVAALFLAEKKESRLHQTAKAAALVAPVIFMSALGLAGVGQLALPYILGWSTLAAAVVGLGLSCALSKGREYTPEEKAILESLKHDKEIYESHLARNDAMHASIKKLGEALQSGDGKYPNIPKQVLYTFKQAFALISKIATDSDRLFQNSIFSFAHQTLIGGLASSKVPAWADKTNVPPAEPIAYLEWVVQTYKSDL